MAWAIVVYAVTIIAVGVWRRSHSSGDQYLMGDRNASALMVGAALFTLVGGGELVTLTALAFSFGFGALTLFIGYSAGFLFLAFISERIREEPESRYHLSLPDYIHARFGFGAGLLVSGVSFLAFFALLVVQFIAAGELMSPLLGVSYEAALLSTGIVALTYLVVGGFETVLITDLIQAASRLLLIPLLLVVGFGGVGDISRTAVEDMPVSLAVSLIITGFFAASSSADVWQRIYAARDIRAARVGLTGGGIALVSFGALLVAVGLIAAGRGLTTDPNAAFGAVMSAGLPQWAAVVAILLVLATVMSTADTEMFLTGGLISREIVRVRSRGTSAEIASSTSVPMARVAVILCSFAAMGFALLVRDLVQVYTWLISALLIIAPTVIGSLFIRRDVIAGRASLTVSLVAFVLLASTGRITPETAYVVLLPGFTAYGLGLLFRPRDKQ